MVKANQQNLHRCNRCGVPKPLSELNGYDPLNSDYSNAYCQRIAECESQEAYEQMDEILAVLEAA